jgi:hypothetical protein
MNNRLSRRFLYVTAALAAIMAPAVIASQEDARAARPAKAPTPIRRMADGRPNLEGYYDNTAGGANQGLGPHVEAYGRRAGDGFVIDPPGGKLPFQPWAAAEQQNRALPERGYDDPQAHCFTGGLPRAMYTSPFQLLQTSNYVVLLFDEIGYRSIPLDGRGHINDSVRLWQGDPVGRWEGDVLVVETRNFNGKAWLNQIGEPVSHAEQLVERFAPVDGDTINYQATVTDPVVYTQPWTIAYQFKRAKQELLENACREDDQDLPRLKAVKDAARAGKKS